MAMTLEQAQAFLKARKAEAEANKGKGGNKSSTPGGPTPAGRHWIALRAVELANIRAENAIFTKIFDQDNLNPAQTERQAALLVGEANKVAKLQFEVDKFSGSRDAAIADLK